MQKQSRQKLFENTFGEYRNFTLLEKFVQKFEVHRSTVLLKLIPKQGATILDLACGDGALLMQLYSRYKNLIGIDIAKNRIQKAKARFKKVRITARLIAHNLDKGIPLSSTSVSVVCCEASLAYFSDPEFMIDEIHRVLKHKGVCVVQIGNYAFLPRRIKLFLGYLPKVSSFKGFGDGGMIHYFTYQTLKELFETRGFKVVAVECSGIFPNLRKVWPSLLASDIIYKVVKVKN